MMYKKLKGSIFQPLPLESFSIEDLVRHTDSSKEEVQPAIDQLLKEGFIKGKKRFRLKNVPSHVRNIPKC